MSELQYLPIFIDLILIGLLINFITNAFVPDYIKELPIKARITIVLVLSALIFIISFNLKFISNPLEASITSHQNQDQIYFKSDIRGDFKNLRDGDKLWLVLHDLDTNKYYFNDVEIYGDKKSTGTWLSDLVQAGGGENRDIGRPYAFLLIIADRQASEKIKSVQYKGIKRDDFPEGIKELDKVTVTRR